MQLHRRTALFICISAKKAVPLRAETKTYTMKRRKYLILFAPLLLCGTLLVSCAKTTPDYNNAGTIVRDTLNNVPCCVYLPKAYDERAKSEIFPVLYLQHGMWGNENDWPDKGNLVAIMDTLLQAGKIAEMVVVMPDNCPSRPSYEEELANATTGEWENNFAQLMAEAEARYSIGKKPAQRAIAGLSMGGYHTMMVSHILDGQFAYVAMFSPATFVHCAPSEPALLWVGIGKLDFLYKSLQDYRLWLEENHREYTYYESTGGHTWDNWQDYIARFLPLCFTTVECR